MSASDRETRPGATAYGPALPPAKSRLSDEFSVKALRLVLGFGVADAVLDLVVGVVNGAGLKRVMLGSGCVVAASAALVQYRRLAVILARRPWLILVAAAASAVPIALDGGADSTLVDVPMALTLVAAVVSSVPVTLLTGLVIGVAFVVATVAAGVSFTQLLSGPHAYDVVTSLFVGPLSALAAALVAGGFRVVLAQSDVWLAAVRGGADASTPALGRLIRGDAPLLLGAGAPPPALTDSERSVVELLAQGLRAKQIARRRGTSEATVRTQIKRAKRKTGARTLDQLVTIVCGMR